MFAFLLNGSCIHIRIDFFLFRCFPLFRNVEKHKKTNFWACMYTNITLFYFPKAINASRWYCCFSLVLKCVCLEFISSFDVHEKDLEIFDEANDFFVLCLQLCSLFLLLFFWSYFACPHFHTSSAFQLSLTQIRF